MNATIKRQLEEKLHYAARIRTEAEDRCRVIYAEIGSVIEAIRKVRKLNRYELAALVGVKPDVISRIEKGKEAVSVRMLNRILKTLDHDTAND